MYDLMMRDIIVFSEKYLPASVAGAIILMLCYHMLRIYLNRKRKTTDCMRTGNHKLAHTTVLFVFFTYLSMVICITFLSREPGSRDAIRLQLFQLFFGDTWARAFAIENIILFLPFGFLLPITFSRCNSFRHCMIIGICSSVGIELIQYITKMGFCEIDDILNNTIGMMIGYGVLIVVRTFGGLT